MTIPDATSSISQFLDKLAYRRYLRVFAVQKPVTLFVRGSRCKVIVNYHELDQIEIYASLYAAFGMRLVIEQDEAGVYIVIRRRRFWGTFSRSDVTIHVPFYCRLALNLTPGDVELQQLNGILEIPPFAQQQAVKATFDAMAKREELPTSTSPRLKSGK